MLVETGLIYLGFQVSDLISSLLMRIHKILKVLTGLTDSVLDFRDLG